MRYHANVEGIALRQPLYFLPMIGMWKVLGYFPFAAWRAAEQGKKNTATPAAAGSPSPPPR